LFTVLQSSRHVPPEILSQIFMATLRTQDALPEVRPRWLMTLVCRKWRSVALSLPALLSYSIVHPPSLAPKIEAQLVRSKQAPLDLVM
jgi:hypothetical protein